MSDDVVARVTDQYRLVVGRGLRGEPYEDARVELSVDLSDLGAELDEAMLPFEGRRSHVWLPLTSTLAGAPVLVWEADDGLIPTHVPVEGGVL
jgi:hypothetical protein